MNAVVCHGDLDGLASAAILLDTLRGTSTIVKTAQPYLLQNALASLHNIEQLYILDIAVDEGSWNSISFHLNRLVGYGCKVLWIDHHISTLNRITWLLELGISLIITIEYCTSTILRRIFCKSTSNPDFFTKLSYLGELGDRIRKDHEELHEIVDTIELALMTSIGDEEFKRRLIKLWISEYKLVDEEVLERAERGKVELNRVLKMVEDNVIFSSDLAEIVDLRGFKVRGYVGRAASIRADIVGKMVFIIHEVNPKEVIFTARAPSDSHMDVLSILRKSLSEIGGMGGGHLKAASYRLNSALIRLGIDRLRSILKTTTTMEPA